MYVIFVFFFVRKCHLHISLLFFQSFTSAVALQSCTFKKCFTMVERVPNKKSETVRNAILSMFRHFPQAVKSITLDNGTEFSDHKTIANCLNAPVYFAHPHSPWERGTNENTNCLLRQYFPKKMKTVYTSAYLADCRQKLNTRPRKCLGFASPASRFFFELRGLHFRVERALVRFANFEILFKLLQEIHYMCYY